MSDNSRDLAASADMAGDGDRCSHVTGESCGHVTGEDVYMQLVQREHELMLAAELGKALLEKNQELSSRQEQIVEEYSAKVEALTQDKHGLRLRLDTLEREYESTVRELQGDLRELTSALDEKESDRRHGRRERSEVVEELMQQNETLAEQLTKAHDTEKELRSQLRSLHDEMEMRSHTTQDTIMCMEALSKQMSSLKRKKEELEGRCGRLSEERSSLVESVDDWQDRLNEKERMCKQQAEQIHDLEKSVEELRERNHQLQQRLTSGQQGGGGGEGGSDLYSELSMSGLTQAMSTESLDGAGRQQEWSSAPQYGMTFYGCDPSMFEDDDEIEFDEVDYTMRQMGYYGNTEIYHGNTESNHVNTGSPVSQKTLTSVTSRGSEEEAQARDDCVEECRLLKQLVCEMRGEQGGEETHSTEYRAGTLREIITQVREAVEGLTAQKPELEDRLHAQQEQISSLTRKLRAAETEVDKMAAEVMFKEEQVMRRGEDVQSLAKQLKQEHELSSSLLRERDRLLDQKVKVTQHGVISEVRGERDKVIKRKNQVELELARSRLDMVHLDQQLLEAVQQKLELAQQLDLWQADMEELIDKQVKKRIREESKDKSRPASSPPHSKPFSLLRR